MKKHKKNNPNSQQANKASKTHQITKSPYPHHTLTIPSPKDKHPLPQSHPQVNSSQFTVNSSKIPSKTSNYQKTFPYLCNKYTNQKNNNYGKLQRIRPRQHNRNVQRRSRRRLCHPCLQLQQYGADAINHSSMCRNKITRDSTSISRRTQIRQPNTT